MEKEDTQTPWITVVVPCYREAKEIRGTLNTIVEYLRACDRKGYEIIVVDDGSRDDTPGLVREYAAEVKGVRVIENASNRGKGFSVKQGVLEARGEYVLFTDADLSTPIGELEKLLKVIGEGFDVAIGSRALPDSELRVHQPFYREYSGKVFNALMRLITGLKINDSQCGFKCFKRASALEIFKRQTLERFSFDVEDLYIARKLGYRIKEVPVLWVNNESSTVSFLKDSVRMFTDLLQIRLNDMRGKYSRK